MANNSKKCPHCGEGEVRDVAAPGRPWPYRLDWRFEIPASTALPACDKCDYAPISHEQAQDLDEQARAAFIAEQSKHLKAMVTRIQQNTGVKLVELERACGVTKTYLSHVLKGRREASDTLTFLLEAFARYPAEVRRRLAASVPLDTYAALNPVFDLRLWEVSTVGAFSEAASAALNDNFCGPTALTPRPVRTVIYGI